MWETGCPSIRWTVPCALLGSEFHGQLWQDLAAPSFLRKGSRWEAQMHFSKSLFLLPWGHTQLCWGPPKAELLGLLCMFSTSLSISLIDVKVCGGDLGPVECDQHSSLLYLLHLAPLDSGQIGGTLASGLELPWAECGQSRDVNVSLYSPLPVVPPFPTTPGMFTSQPLFTRLYSL